MANNFRQDGKTLEYTNSGAALASGDARVVSQEVGIAHDDIANGEDGVLHMEGVWRVPKATGQAWVRGEAVNVDVNGEFTTGAAGGGGLTGAGIVWADAASGDTTGEVKINQRAGIPA